MTLHDLKLRARALLRPGRAEQELLLRVQRDLPAAPRSPDEDGGITLN